MKKNHEELSKQLEGIRDIQKAFSAIIEDSPRDQKEELICRTFKKMTQARDVALFLQDTKSKNYGFRASANKRARKYTGGFLEVSDSVLRTIKMDEIHAAPSHDITIQTINNVYNFRNKFVMVFPVTAFSRVYGILLCEYDSAFIIKDTNTRELIGYFTSYLGPLFAYYVETQRSEEKAKSLELLYEIGSKLSSIRGEDQLLQAILDLIEKHIQVNRCSLMIVDDDRKYLRIKKAFGIHDVDINKVKVPIGEGIAGYVATGTRPLLIKDISAEKHLISQVPQKEGFRTKSLLSVPLVAQGEAIGVINVNNRKDGRPFSEADMELLCKIGTEIASVLQRSYMALQLKKAKELDGDIKRFMI